jgi:hypothetical protein
VTDKGMQKEKNMKQNTHNHTSTQQSLTKEREQIDVTETERDDAVEGMEHTETEDENMAVLPKLTRKKAVFNTR